MTEDIEHITSTANSTIKYLKSLDRKKNRNEYSAFLAEGERIIRDGLAHGWVPQTLLVSSDSDQMERCSDLIGASKSLGARVLTASRKVLMAVARKDNPQTMLAAFKQQHRDLSTLSLERPSRVLALYEVRDPGNLGTIMRTADASNVSGVVLINQCCDPYSIECVRATMGAIFSVPFIRCEYTDFREWAALNMLKITAASVNGERRHDEVVYGAQSVLLMGNEQSGIPSEVEAECAELIRLPMSGAADSLNLAQATGIVSYQIWKEHGYVGAR